MIFHSKKEIASKKLLMILSSTLTLCVLSSFSIPLASAQTAVNNPSQNDSNSQYTLLEPLPCVPGNGVNCVAGTLQKKIDFGTYVQYIFNLIIAISAVAAVLVIVAGGFKYMTTDSFGGKDEGKKMITEALKGLLLVLCSFLILRTIDPRLVSIPSTIVKPLDVMYDSSATYGFFEQLAQEANKYKIESAALIAEREKVRADVTAAEKRLQDLETKKATLSEQLEADDPQLKALGVDIQAEKDIISTKKDDLVFSQKIALVTGILNSYTNSFDFIGDSPTTKIGEYSLDTLQKDQAALNQAHNDALSILQKMGNPKEKVEQLNNAYNDANANIILLKNTPQNSTDFNASIGIIKLRVESIAVNSITDESIKTALKQKAASLITQLEAAQAQKNTNDQMRGVGPR